MKKANKYLGQPEKTPENARGSSSTAVITAFTAPAAPVPALDTLLSPYLNLTQDQKTLYYSWLLQQSLYTDGMVPGPVTGGLPILALSGPLGCGKSLLAKITKGILVAQEWIPVPLQAIPPQDITDHLDRTTIITYDNISNIPEQYSDSLVDLAKAGFYDGQGIILNGTGFTIPERLTKYTISLELKPLDKPVPAEDLLLPIGNKLAIIQQAFIDLKNEVYRELVVQLLFSTQDHSQLPTHVDPVPDSLFNYYNIASAYLKVMDRAERS